MSRLRRLSLFAGGRLPSDEPELTVRRSSRRPNRLGFAVPTEWRLSVTAYPGARESDLLETLLHELVHLHVGAVPEAHRWHGATFKRTLAAAMHEAYDVTGVNPGSIHHGPYAKAIALSRDPQRSLF
jgi:hypothetical protein